MVPNAPAPVTAAVDRKRRRESLRENLRGISIVMHASLIGQQDALKALTDVGRLYDGRITARPVHNVPVARNCAPARCRFCGMLISNALRSATALWNCSSAILKAVRAPSSMA